MKEGLNNSITCRQLQVSLEEQIVQQFLQHNLQEQSWLKVLNKMGQIFFSIVEMNSIFNLQSKVVLIWSYSQLANTNKMSQQHLRNNHYIHKPQIISNKLLILKLITLSVLLEEEEMIKCTI